MPSPSHQPQIKSAAASERATRATRAVRQSTARTEANPAWTHVATGIQRKVTVTPPDDPFEREADAVADRVMRMTDSGDVAPAVVRIQRKCACGGSGDSCGCGGHDHGHDDEKVHMKRATTATPAPAHLLAAAGVGRSPGVPLSSSVRAYFEPRFGRTFGDVRVHADAGAATAARDIQARAYTLGRSVVFGAGEFAPATDAGRRLLAHELTHVVQQTGGGARIVRASRDDPVIQRALSDDFHVDDLAPRDIANPSMIFFQRGSAALPIAGTERAKIAALAAPPAQALTLNGFASEEGTDAGNDSLVAARLAVVGGALRAAGHTGGQATVNLRASGSGQISYRHMRAVEVLPTPVGLAVAPSGQSACDAAGSEVAPCGSALTLSHTIALTTMMAANIKLATPGDVDATALLARLFGGVPRATVLARMASLATQVQGLPANHRCHSDCDAGCGRPAYNAPPSGATGGQMTLCPAFLTSTDENWRARTLIHESAHGTPGFGAEDIAYANTRQIAFLSAADQLRNTDSYVLLAWLLAHPGSIPIGPATPDVLTGLAMTPAEQDAAHRAIAWLESWLNYGDFDTETLYATVNRSVPIGAWATGQLGDEFNRENQHKLSPVFGLTDPGAAAPFTPPTSDDKFRIAGIHDRFDQMYKAVNWRVLTVTRGPAGSDQWGGAVGSTVPRLTQAVTVGPTFFGMAVSDQVKHLALLMARAMHGISPAFAPKYPDALDQLRRQRSIGP